MLERHRALAFCRQLGKVVAGAAVFGLDSAGHFGAGELPEAGNQIGRTGRRCRMVTHDVHVSLSVVDYVYFVAQGKVVAQGTPDEVRTSTDPFVRQFIDGAPDGPVRLHYPAADFAADLGLQGIQHA